MHIQIIFFSMSRRAISILLLLISISVSGEQKKTTFWRIEDLNGKSHFLFGTIHVDDNRVTNFHKDIFDALANVDLFLNETDEITDMSILFNEQPIIAEELSEQELEKIKELSYFHTMSYENNLKMKPWLLALIFNSPRPITPYNQDNLLKSYALDKGLRVQGIATVNEHFQALDNIPDEEQIAILKKVLARSEKNRIDDYESLIKTYLMMDVERILEIDQKNTASIVPDKVWVKIKHNLLIKRNQLFFDRIQTRLKNNRLFIAVGASHLGGENGLLQQFRSRGFHLVPLDSLN